VLASALAAFAAEPAIERWDRLGGKRIFRPTDGVEIALAAADRDRVESWVGISEHRPLHRVLTGPAWAQIFRGDPAKGPVLTLKSASVREEPVAARFATRVTYVVEATLTTGNREQLIHAQGSETSGRSGIYAVRGAVEKCVLDAARQATAELAKPESGESTAR
jgi:hypothetical protein